MGIATSRWDVTEHLDSPEAIAAYLEAAIEEDDPAFFRKALSDVARAKGMSQVARDAGITRPALYKALGEGGNPSMATVMGVMKALGVKLAVAA